jgi:hypothetical protein
VSSRVERRLTEKGNAMLRYTGKAVQRGGRWYFVGTFSVVVGDVAAEPEAFELGPFGSREAALLEAREAQKVMRNKMAETLNAEQVHELDLKKPEGEG